MKVTVTILDERLNVKVSTSKIEVPVYHKVTNGGTEQIQSDFEQTDETAVDFIKNKPTIDNAVTKDGQNAVKSSGIWTWAKGLFTPKNPAETEADTLTDESVFQFWKGELKKITWANIKATLRTYFDTIYSTFSGSYNDLSHKPTIPSNAAQITVSEPVTPDFTPAVQGNNLQQVTNKVAGLQERLIVDITVDEEHRLIDIENLNIGKKDVVNLVMSCNDWPTADNTSGYIYININNIDSNNYDTHTPSGGGLDLQYFRLIASNNLYLSIYIHIVADGVLIFGQYFTKIDPTRLYNYTVGGKLRVAVTTITSIGLSSSSVASFKTGDNIKLYRL